MECHRIGPSLVPGANDYILNFIVYLIICPTHTEYIIRLLISEYVHNFIVEADKEFMYVMSLDSWCASPRDE